MVLSLDILQLLVVGSGRAVSGRGGGAGAGAAAGRGLGLGRAGGCGPGELLVGVEWEFVGLDGCGTVWLKLFG